VVKVGWIGVEAIREVAERRISLSRLEPQMVVTSRARRWGLALAGLPLTAAVVVGGTPAAFAQPVPASTSTVPSGPVSHADADHMGSTIRAHQPLTATAAAAPALSAAVVGQPYGMDVSAFQGNVDWSAAARTGGQFVYIKASESTGYLNPYFAQQYNGSKAAGLIRGAYHFALPDRSNGATQANYFLDNGGGWSPDGYTLPPMLDIEYNPYGSTCYNLSAAAMSSWIAEFSTTVHTRTGQFPTIYTTRDWWDTCTGSNPGFAATNALFIANYSTSPGLMAAGWGSESIWQYSDQGVFPGDQDVFNGTAAQLRAFAGAAQPPAPVTTPISSLYNSLGGASSYLGAAVGGEYPAAGGTAQNYQFGRIYSSTLTGTHAVHGAILDRYLALAGPAGLLGLPTTDENPGGNGGRYNNFAGGAITWTPSTGAHETHGAIRTHWAALGYEHSVLGYPTTDESPAAYGGRYNNFTGGAITWTPTTGAHETHGAIRTRWAALGYERGPLGYPTSDETPVPGGLRSTFQHGTITWNQTTNQLTVQTRP